MNVDLIDHMGTDLTVVNAARVSMAKESEWVYDENECESVSAYHASAHLSDKDTKLIQYLATHGHWSPFAHPQITLRVKAPIFVARQLAKHQVGLAWNEVSRRYVDSEPEFYEPKVWRKKADSVKQGSSDAAAFDSDRRWMNYVIFCEEALELYKFMLLEGVAPEQARMVLPQSMYTEWYWTGSLYAFSRVAKQRQDSHTQRETQEVAKQISEIIEPLFPVSWKALLG